MKSLVGLNIESIGTGSGVTPGNDGYRVTTGTTMTGESRVSSEERQWFVARHFWLPDLSTDDVPFEFTYGIGPFQFVYDETSPMWRFRGIDFVDFKTFVVVESEFILGVAVAPDFTALAGTVRFMINGAEVGHLRGDAAEDMLENMAIRKRGKSTMSRCFEVDLAVPGRRLSK
jgi:hypothetical protein